jgi:predicted transposase/invertase (TIGR01784 family)
VLQKINFNTLQIENDSYVDEELKEHFSDLVYNCQYHGKEKIKITLLLEHKSYQPQYPHLQLLKYLLKIWERNVKQKEALVPVIPIIVYHGKKSWETKDFYSYFKGIDEDITCFLPHFDYVLTDLTVYSDEEIERVFEQLVVQICLKLMKNIFDDKKLEQKLQKIFSGIGTLIEKEQGKNFLESIIRYLYESTDIPDKNITTHITTITKKGGKIAMTTAERLRQEGKLTGIKEGKMEGIKEGKMEGIKEGKLKDVRMMIKEGFDNQTIHRITGISIEEVEQLRQE